jgi:hypothetical protein
MSTLLRYTIVSFSRHDTEGVDERLREMGLETWEMISVLPGTRENPNDADHFTCFFKRDASTDIGI